MLPCLQEHKRPHWKEALPSVPEEFRLDGNQTSCTASVFHDIPEYFS